MSVSLWLNGVWPGSSVEVRDDQWVHVPVMPPYRRRSIGQVPPLQLIVPVEVPHDTLNAIISIVHPDYDEWIRAVWFTGSLTETMLVDQDLKKVEPLVIYAPRPTGQRKLLL